MDKWIMFKNYMHNDLGITKHDIKTWIEEAVDKIAERLVAQEFSKFEINKVIDGYVKSDRYFSNSELKRTVQKTLTDALIDKIDISIKKEL